MHEPLTRQTAAPAADTAETDRPTKKRIYARWISADEAEIFRGPVLLWRDTVYVNPPPRVLEQAGYLPLSDGTLRCGKNLRTLYSTDGHRILRHTIEVTQ